MHRFLIMIEKTEDNYSTYSHDLTGCIATDTTVEEAKKNMHEAIEMHVKGMKEDNIQIQESHSITEYMAV